MTMPASYPNRRACQAPGSCGWSQVESGVPKTWTEEPPMPMPSASRPSNPVGRFWTGVGAVFALRDPQVGRLEQLPEIVEHEVGVLQLVDFVGPAHHLGRLERQALDVAFDRMVHFLGRGQDAGTVDLEAGLGADQAELDSVPVE